MTWTTEQGIYLCCLLEPIAKIHNCHVALTGGLLYKGGERKDCDIVIYRRGKYIGERDLPIIDKTGLLEAFAAIIDVNKVYSRVAKCAYEGNPVDLLFVNGAGSEGGDGGTSA